MLSANLRHLVQRQVKGSYRLTVRRSKTTSRMAATVTVENQVTHSLEPEKPDASVVDTVSSEEDAGDELAGFRESTFMSILRYIPRACMHALQRINHKEASPFLEGVFAPVDTETFSNNLKVVSGAIPPELSGYYLRTGANPQHQPWGGYHWFDGDAMVHAIRFAQGAALSYSNRWLRTKRFLYEKAAQCNLFMRLGDVRGILGVIIMFLTKLFDFFLVPKKYDLLTTGHAGNTALYWYKGKLLALMDLSFPFLARICAGVVESVSEFTFGGTLEHACTAHPKLDTKTGELLAVGYGTEKPLPGTNHMAGFFTVSPSGKKGKTYPIDTQVPVMMHDFAVTENYVIFLDHALVVDPGALVKRNTLPLRTELSRPSRIGVMHRAAPEDGIVWLETDPFVIFHLAAAWEEGSIIHFIGCRHSNVTFNSKYDVGVNSAAVPARYTINVATGEVTYTILCKDYDVEFPVFPPHLLFKAAKYTYMVGNLASERTHGVKMNCIIKADNMAEEGKGLEGSIKLPEGYVCGEFSIALRHPPSTAAEHAEDDGWLVGFVIDEKTLESYCMVYDAQTMSEVPVAKVAMPQRVPLGFHGAWLPTEQANEQDVSV